MKTHTQQLLELSAEIESKATSGKWISNGLMIMRGKEPFHLWIVQASCCNPSQEDTDNIHLIAHSRNTLKAKDAQIKLLYEALEIAIDIIGDGDNGPPQFYVDVFETMENAKYKCDAIAKDALESEGKV